MLSVGPITASNVSFPDSKTRESILDAKIRKLQMITSGLDANADHLVEIGDSLFGPQPQAVSGRSDGPAAVRCRLMEFEDAIDRLESVANRIGSCVNRLSEI